ncbi:MAG TPA: Spo0E family sporulation regulatory protein-aspartic acid phosphatase [Candidatus Blautia merdigallinarum]|uniref:Spo0E family sporulation regulatory protein-aspartic acid phosphatase n=1 Tax=Candidatus Blautia merdigallinarum TaxID=2838495 RepID=A0A9D2SJ25_9FIRM|nr:Spo0E family sporulation regulatory protein-aspartic acid phosphatase [Candidatus Blautia merdigallinarum]
MTQIELERKIENTREDLNAAIAGNMTKSRILDISRLLDGLIEEYLDQNGSRKGTEDEQALYMGKGRQKGC